MARPPSPWYRAGRDAWYAQVNGKQVLLARGKANKARARTELHRLLAGLPREGEADPASLTVREVASLFLADVKAAVGRGEREQVTYDGYFRLLKSAVKAIGPETAATLKPHQVRAWTDDPGRAWGPTQRFNAVTALKAALNWAVRAGHLPSNPIKTMERPTPRRRTAILTAEQVAAILAAVPDRQFRDLLIAIGQTGCRPGEVATLTAEGVDLAAGVWRVRNKTRRKTGDPVRIVALTGPMVELSRRLVAAHPEGPIFRNTRGNPWTRHAMACRFADLREKLGLGKAAAAYSLRHRYGTDGLLAGLTSAQVAALMGHRDSTMVDRVYSHLADEIAHLRASAERVRPSGSGQVPEDVGDDEAGTAA